MEISKIDPNLAILQKDLKGKLIDASSDSVKMFGLMSDEENHFLRMPLKIAKEVSEGVLYLATNTSGGRIAFKTNTKNLTIHVSYDFLDHLPHMAQTGSAGFSLNEIVKGKQLHCHTFTFNFDSYKGYKASIKTLKGNKEREFVLYFPLYNEVKSLYLEIDKNAYIMPFDPYRDIKPILYYGSSITQGGCSSRPDTCYQGLVSKWTNIDYINLGFSGSCKAEDKMSLYISSLDPSVFVYDYDYNTNSVEHLKSTHEKLFLNFRKNHPNTPIIIMSAVNYYTEGKDANLKDRRLVVKETYDNAIKNGDKNVYFIDGKNILPKELRYEATVDGCHPTDLGFYFMAKAVYKVLKQIKEIN